MKTWIDEGPPGYNADKYTPTREDVGEVEIAKIIHLPGGNNEHKLFRRSSTGRKTVQEWASLKAELVENGMPGRITIFKERNGHVRIYEGNHRLRAALELGWTVVPVEIRYFGNSQREGLVA